MEPNAPENEPAPDQLLGDRPTSAEEENIPEASGDAAAAPPEAEDEAAPPAGSTDDELTGLAAQAQTRRLSAAEEERAAALLKERLLAGKTGVAEAGALLPKLAWMVGVAAVGDVWAEMKATSKAQLLKVLADDESDAARRVRLSLARALFKLQDVPTALKIAVAVAKEMRGKETGEISARDTQSFSNVFLGKAKPWCSQLPLGELRPADADVLVHCAVVAAFATPHSPVTQLGVLKWAAENGRLAKLHESALPLVTKSLGRWGSKWNAALRNEVQELPEELRAALPALPERAQGHPAGAVPLSEEDASGAQEGGSSDDPLNDAGEEAPSSPAQRERPVYVSKTMPSRESGDDQRRDDRAGPRPSPQEGTSPVPSRGPAPRHPQFNIGDALRQIDAHVSWLRSELKNAENKARPRDEDRRGRRRPENVIIQGEPSIEELARLNVQLESRIETLQARITELTADSEDRAASRGALVDAPAPSVDAQLRTLLALKLQEDYADFLALEQESRDLVVQQHYRSLLRGVFEVLKTEGVPLQIQAEAATP